MVLERKLSLGLFLFLSWLFSVAPVWASSPAPKLPEHSADAAVWPPKAPIYKCKWCGDKSADGAHFDCDDFGYAYKKWWDCNFPDQKAAAWQVVYHGQKASKDSGHVMIVIEVLNPPPKHQFCLIEYYTNTEVGCWEQSEGAPSTPVDTLKKVETHYQWDEGSTEQIRAWNDPSWLSDGFGGCISRWCKWREACFTRYQGAVKMFKEQTGLDPYTFKPLQE